MSNPVPTLDDHATCGPAWPDAGLHQRGLSAWGCLHICHVDITEDPLGAQASSWASLSPKELGQYLGLRCAVNIAVSDQKYRDVWTKTVEVDLDVCKGPEVTSLHC